MGEKHKSKIPYDILGEILKAYEFGRKEDLELYSNDYIASSSFTRQLEIWANWTDIFEIRDKLRGE